MDWVLEAEKLKKKVGPAIVLVDDSLTVLEDQVVVSHERDWQEHIAIESKGTRRNVDEWLNGERTLLQPGKNQQAPKHWPHCQADCEGKR